VRIDVLTLFPAMLDGFLSESMLGRAQEAKLLEIKVHNTRNWATDKHKTTDDRPFGGGAGMVMKCEPIFDAIEQLQTPGCRRIYLTPDGTPFTAARAGSWRSSNILSLSAVTTRGSTSGSATRSSTRRSASAITC
jgi:tRNA (guanine37-N1)-methyltransferase